MSNAKGMTDHELLSLYAQCCGERAVKAGVTLTVPSLFSREEYDEMKTEVLARMNKRKTDVA